MLWQEIQSIVIKIALPWKMKYRITCFNLCLKKYFFSLAISLVHCNEWKGRWNPNSSQKANKIVMYCITSCNKFEKGAHENKCKLIAFKLWMIFHIFFHASAMFSDTNTFQKHYVFSYVLDTNQRIMIWSERVTNTTKIHS